MSTSLTRSWARREARAKVIAAASLDTSSEVSTSGQPQLPLQVFPVHFSSCINLNTTLSQAFAVSVSVGTQPAAEDTPVIQCGIEKVRPEVFGFLKKGGPNGPPFAKINALKDEIDREPDVAGIVP